VRGSDDTSALPSKLGFTVDLTGYDETSLSLKLNFEHPLSVSIGESPDIARITFVEPGLFVSRESGKSVDSDSEAEKTVPKQFPSEESFELAVVAGSTV